MGAYGEARRRRIASRPRVPRATQATAPPRPRRACRSSPAQTPSAFGANASKEARGNTAACVRSRDWLRRRTVCLRFTSADSSVRVGSASFACASAGRRVAPSRRTLWTTVLRKGQAILLRQRRQALRAPAPLRRARFGGRITFLRCAASHLRPRVHFLGTNATCGDAIDSPQRARHERISFAASRDDSRPLSGAIRGSQRRPRPATLKARRTRLPRGFKPSLRTSAIRLVPTGARPP